jgi:hypothetical protein
MEKELTLFPLPLIPWVSTYRVPAGRDEELPQLSKNKLRAHRPTSTTTAFIFFDIYSPEGFPSPRFIADWGVNRFQFAGDLRPVVMETEPCG